MVYNKKGLFFRKLTAKVVGNSSQKRKGDKCHTVQKAPSPHHHQEADANGRLPLLTAVKSIISPSSPNLNNTQRITSTSHASNTNAVSGLLYAKLRCDEWGVQSRAHVSSKKMSTVSSQAASTFSSGPKRRRHPVQRPRSTNKVHHPSYKPPNSQRSTSMKERREMENAMKYINFSPSLYIIDEVDERGLD